MDRIRWKTFSKGRRAATVAVAICMALVAGAILTRGPKVTLLIKNPARYALPRFGVAVAPFGDDILATGILKSSAQESGGFKDSAVFLLSGKDGRLLFTLKDPGACPQSAFGVSLTVIGTKFAVGAPGTFGLVGPAAGAVHIFELDRADPGHPRLLRTLRSPAPTKGDWFGQSAVMVQGLLAVGAPGADDCAGAVFLFNPETGELVRALRDRKPKTPGTFGYALANVNGLLAVGAINDQMIKGAAYIYDPQTGARTLALASPQPYGSSFGEPLAVAGDKLIVGAPSDPRDPSIPYSMSDEMSNHGSAYLFNPATGACLSMLRNTRPYDGARFGSSIASLGDHIFISAPGYRRIARADQAYLADCPGWVYNASQPGAVYVFGPTGGRPLRKIRAPHPKPDDEFGRLIVPWGENLLIVGRYSEWDHATDSDAIYVCRNPGK